MQGRLDQRNFNDTDIPATPLPYDDITLISSGSIWEDVPNNAGPNAGLFGQIDWGPGLDFYISQIIILHKTAVKSNGRFVVNIFSTVTAVDEFIIRESVSGFRPILHEGDWNTIRVWNLPTLRRVLKSDEITGSLFNASGQTCDFVTYLSGIPK